MLENFDMFEGWNLNKHQLDGGLHHQRSPFGDQLHRSTLVIVLSAVEQDAVIVYDYDYCVNICQF